MGNLLTIVAIFVVAILALIGFLVSRFIKVPGDKIMIIEGKGGGWCKGGKGKFIIPGIQQVSFLDTKPIILKGSVQGVSSESVEVKIDYSMPFYVSTTDALIPNAIRCLRGVDKSTMISMVKEIADGQIRGMLTTLSIEEINGNRDKFTDAAKVCIEPLIQKFGLDMATINISDIKDNGGIIEARGEKAVAETLKESKIKVAIQNKESDTGVSDQNRERDTQLANINKDRDVNLALTEKDRAVTVAQTKKDKDIAIAETEQQYNISKAEIKTKEDSAVAEQSALLEVSLAETESKRESGVAVANAEKEIKIAEAKKNQDIKIAVSLADAEVGKIEQAKKVTIEESALKVVEAEAKERAEISAVRANANIEQERNVSQQKVEAEKAKLTKAALVATTIVPAEMEKEARIIEAESEAQTILIKAKAEAEAESIKIREIAKAEADGIKMKLSAELDAQAEGFKRMIEAAGDNKELAIQYKMIDIMPELAEKQAEAIKSMKIDSIQVWDKDNGNTTANFIENFIKGAGPALGLVNGTIKDSFNKMLEPKETSKGDVDFGPIND